MLSTAHRYVVTCEGATHAIDSRPPLTGHTLHYAWLVTPASSPKHICKWRLLLLVPTEVVQHV